MCVSLNHNGAQANVNIRGFTSTSGVASPVKIEWLRRTDGAVLLLFEFVVFKLHDFEIVTNKHLLQLFHIFIHLRIFEVRQLFGNCRRTPPVQFG